MSYDLKRLTRHAYVPSMSQTAHRDLEGSGDQGMCHTVTYHFDVFRGNEEECRDAHPSNEEDVTITRPMTVNDATSSGQGASGCAVFKTTRVNTMSITNERG
jgi:hypothetical protein